MMELSYLRYFFEVARAGSFTGAARSLRISQPSLSKAVRLLEEREGISLFNRSKKGVTLTATGLLAFESCERVFGEIECLKDAFAGHQKTCSGDLGLGASDNLCNYVLPPIFTAFRRQFPLVHVKLSSGTAESIKEGILSGKLELGMFYTPVRGRSFIAERISFVEFVIVTASRAAKNARSLSELSGLGYVGSLVSDYIGPYPALRMLRSLGLRSEVTFETNNQETQKRMVIQGYGFSVLPFPMVKEELKAKVLVRFPTPKKIGASVFLVQKKGRRLTKPADNFREFLKATNDFTPSETLRRSFS